MTPGEAGAVAAVRLRAHGKLTLSLAVVGRRPDGYHDLDALMVSLADLADSVEVALTETGEVTLEVAGAADGVPLDGENLAVRAVAGLLARARPGAGARIGLSKRIPAGTGLGGASADAAAGLVAVARLFPDETAGVDLARTGAALGSDVPFCVTGGLARVRGRGEVVEPLAPAGGWWAVVAVPALRLATASVYGAWDELGGPRSERVVEAPGELAGVAPDGLRNDLEPAALAVCPELGAFRDALAEAAGRRPLLAGSGSAYVVFAAAENEAREIARQVTAALPETTTPAGLVAVSEPGPSGVTLIER